MDGERICEQGVTIDPTRQSVTVNGRAVRPESLCYLALNKPPGYLCSSRDPAGRETFHALLPAGLPRVFSVGRLDRDSEGLLLITNDGPWANRVQHPSRHVLKTYHVWTERLLKPDEQRAAREGVQDRGETLTVHSIRCLRRLKRDALYEMVLAEGRNRHIRRLLERVGVGVVRLRRVCIGPLKLGALKKGDCRHLTAHEVRLLDPGQEDAVRMGHP